MVTSEEMPPRATRSDDAAGTRMLEILVGRVLLWGGLISILVVLAGFGLHLLRGPAEMNSTLVGAVTGPASAAGGSAPGVFVSGAQIIRGLSRSAMDPLAIIALGLVMLLATPVLAVLLSVPAFASIRDYRYAVISLLILCILAVSFFIGG
jgi:uncharacterized membrane protein